MHLHPLKLIVTLWLSILVVAGGLRSASRESVLIQDGAKNAEVFAKNVTPLELRSLDDWQLEDLLIVSDIDGNLHGVERTTGAFMWTLPIDEPLVHIQGSGDLSTSNQTNMLWFVEPFEDGTLYFFSPEFGLSKLPTSIRNLVMESPFSLSGDDKIYTGSRKTSLYTIDITTGEVVSQFGTGSSDDSCPISNIYRDSKTDTAKYIMMGKTTYDLSIHSKLDSEIIWNITYSHWGPNNIDADLILQNHRSLDHLYFTPFHDKSLLAVNQHSGTPSWVCRLPSLAVNVFDVFNSVHGDDFVVLPHPLKQMNDLQQQAENNIHDNLCFVDTTADGKEWFAMSYLNYPTLINSAPTAPYQMALQKFEQGRLETDKTWQLRNFNVSLISNHDLVSGVHKVGQLSPSNNYQPLSRFATREHKLIGDSPSKTESVEKKYKSIPNLIDGIFFPNTRETMRSDISTIDHDDKGLLNKGSYNTNLPVRYKGYNDSTDKELIPEKISMFRRIAEDLFVMSTLLMFFFAFAKLKHFLKARKTPTSPRSYQGETEKLESQPILADEDRLEDDSLYEKSTKSVSDLHEVVAVKTGNQLPEHEDSKILKKVTILEPEDHSPQETAEDADNLSDQDTVSITKKKRKRGSRGGKRGGKSKKSSAENNVDDDSHKSNSNEEGKSDTGDDHTDPELVDDAIKTSSLVKSIVKPAKQLRKLNIDNNLVLSSKILGYGSHGTVVYEGTFENRPVAVKRMLLDFYDIANHEVRLLQESDDHPNVIRYFCSQSSKEEKFLYIALELCKCSLEEIVERRQIYPQSLHINYGAYKNVLYQLVSGLNYLHSLKIVHRDLKPQNILVGEASKKEKAVNGDNSIRLLISDFGLCKKLDSDQSSFRATTQNAASGTSGWRAPELLLHQDLPEISPDTVSSTASKSSNKEFGNGQGKRLTKAIDIFSLGCVFYYILSNGSHPFGDRYLREGNIIKGEYDLSDLDKFCPYDYVEATDLVRTMINFDPRLRPDTEKLLKHPYFWSLSKKLEFLLKVSDRFEIERRDPPSDLLLALESISEKVHGGDWLSKFDAEFIDNLGKYRKYHTEKVMDLLRALRNKYHHYNDMPEHLQKQMSPLPGGFYNYFNVKFPHLLMEIYGVVSANLQGEHIFNEFF